MRIDIPEGQHPIEYVWGDMVPGIGMAAANFSLSVYAHTTLGLREFEAARLRVAQINGCVFCLDWRTEREGRRSRRSSPTPSPTGVRPTRSTSAPGSRRSTPSGTPSTTTGSTRSSGTG